MISPLQHLILLLALWIPCQFFAPRHSVHVLAAGGLVAAAFYAPIAALVIAVTIIEAALLVLILGRLPRQSSLRQFGAYIVLANLLFVDFHALLFNLNVATLGISFSTIRIFMTAKNILSSRKALPKSDLYWIFVSGFYLPALIIGPIFSGLDLKKQHDAGAPVDVTLRDGRMVLQGLVLSVLVATACGVLGEAIAPLLFLQLFAAFWGQSLIAEHSSRFFGYRLPVNFDRPWKARTPQDFWARWHKSMAQFVLQYIFLPLNLRGLSPQLATITAFVFMGLWHNLTLGYLVWGLCHGVMLAYGPKEPAGGLRGLLMQVGLWVAVIGLSLFANYGAYS